MKKIITAILCGALALSIAACGGGDSSSPAATTAAQTTAAPATEAPATEAAADEAVSDETWKDIQDVYAALVEARNATVEAYNDDAVQADADIENALTTADDLIKQVGDINREDVSEADAVDLLEAMVSINDIFKASLDAMQPAG